MDARTTEFAAADAEANFASLLARAEAGEEIVIRRNGRAVAKLVPTGMDRTIADPQQRRRFVDQWVASRGDEPKLGVELTLRDLIAAGRKF